MSTPPVDVKPGAGVDRTLIRAQLARTPAERVQVIIEAARAIQQLRAAKRM
jgi:hypothetical protein